MARKDTLGRAGEERATRYLREQGYTVLDRNWRCDQGEIDIVAAQDDRLCVVEVKTRSSELFGHPFDAVDERKRRRLWRLAFAWAKAHPQDAAGRRVLVQVIGLIGADAETARLEHLEDVQ